MVSLLEQQDFFAFGEIFRGGAVKAGEVWAEEISSSRLRLGINQGGSTPCPTIGDWHMGMMGHAIGMQLGPLSLIVIGLQEYFLHSSGTDSSGCGKAGWWGDGCSPGLGDAGGICWLMVHIKYLYLNICFQALSTTKAEGKCEKNSRQIPIRGPSHWTEGCSG